MDNPGAFLFQMEVLLKAAECIAFNRQHSFKDHRY